MNMWQLNTQQKAKIVDFSASLSEVQKIRLIDLGFALQETVICVKRIPFGGPAVYQVQSSMFALEGSIACHVIVELME
jgi:Fe2+ transport system protein FeoA